MKKYSLFILILFSIAACSKKEEKFELFSPESFAYSMDNGWELNASVRVKGFEQKESDGKYSAKLSYTVDVETPGGKILKDIDSGKIDKTSPEKMMELSINSQIQLDDKKFKIGTCKVSFNVTDYFTGKKASSWSPFELSK